MSADRGSLGGDGKMALYVCLECDDGVVASARGAQCHRGHRSRRVEVVPSVWREVAEELAKALRQERVALERVLHGWSASDHLRLAGETSEAALDSFDALSAGAEQEGER